LQDDKTKRQFTGQKLPNLYKYGLFQIGKCIQSAKLTGKMVLITDTNVDKYQAEECVKAFSDAGYEVSKFVIPQERKQEFGYHQDIYKYLLGLKLDRSATLMALGGGVVGDITGFAAATFLRE